MNYSSQLEDIPGGAPGLALKAKRIRQLVERAKRDPNFRSKTAELVEEIAEKDHTGEIHTLVNFVRNRVRYLRDPWAPGGLELFTDPRTLLRDALRGKASGDCDDHVILASALLETAGYETRYPVGADGPEDYRHIWLEVLHPQTGWISVDLTTKEQEIGWDPGPAYHHVETHTGKGEDMTLGYHHARALPPSFHNAYAEPGVYAGSTPSDFFRAVAIRGALPQGDAFALLGEGHNGSLDGFFSKIAESFKDVVKTVAPIAAGVGGTIIGGPALGQAGMGIVGALTGDEATAQTNPLAATTTNMIGPPPPPGATDAVSAATQAAAIAEAQQRVAEAELQIARQKFAREREEAALENKLRELRGGGAFGGIPPALLFGGLGLGALLLLRKR